MTQIQCGSGDRIPVGGSWAGLAGRDGLYKADRPLAIAPAHACFTWRWLRLGFALSEPDVRLRMGGWGCGLCPIYLSIALTGLTLTFAGCVFAIWARLTLGSNWSGRATVKADHELVTDGPYAVARHPIYTGLLLAVSGHGTGGLASGMASLAVVVICFRADGQDEPGRAADDADISGDLSCISAAR